MTMQSHPSMPPPEVGGRVPNFTLPHADGSNAMFYDRVTGGPVVMLVCASAGEPPARTAIEALADRRDTFGCHDAEIFIVSGDDVAAHRQLSEALGLDAHFMSDPKNEVRPGLLAGAGGHGLRTYVLDPNQRILALIDGGDPARHAEDALAALAAQPAAPSALHLTAAAPVLLLPNVLPLAFCDELVARWQRDHVEGVVGVIVDGRTVNKPVSAKKRSLDHDITDPAMVQRLSRILAATLPVEMNKAFYFDMPFYFDTLIIIGYEAGRGDYFRTHRDNMTPRSVNRRYAMSLNLNDDYDGGELRFPEYGPHLYRPPKGAAAVFSCSLLHEALPVTRGRRLVLTTFFCDSRVRPRQQG